MKNAIRDRMSTGGALVILVILVVAMSMFAVLAVKSSLNEENLAKKTRESIEKFYKMDTEAVRIYAKIDGIIASGADISGELSGIPEITDIQYEGDLPVLIKYSVENSGRTLNVNVGVGEGETFIERWSTKTEADNLEYELQITD